MAANNLFRALLFATLMTYLKCNNYFNMSFGEVPDITKFYTQNETIWTVNTTAATNITCKVDLVNTTTAKFTDFLRLYNWSQTTVKNELHGMFTKLDLISQNETVYDAMLVGPKDAMVTSREQLLFQYENYKCGIFRVSLPLQTQGFHFEVRVKNLTIDKPDRKCMEQFQKLSKKTKVTTMYKDTCQQLIRLRRY